MSRPTNDDIFRELGRLTEQVSSLRTSFDKVEGKVENLMAERNKGMGIIAAVLLVAGVVGAKFGAVFTALFDVGK